MDNKPHCSEAETNSIMANYFNMQNDYYSYVHIVMKFKYTIMVVDVGASIVQTSLVIWIRNFYAQCILIF